MGGHPTISQEEHDQLRRRVRAYMQETGYTNEEADHALSVTRGTVGRLFNLDRFGKRRADRLIDALDHGFNRTAPFDETAARNALAAWNEQRRKRTGENR